MQSQILASAMGWVVWTLQCDLLNGYNYIYDTKTNDLKPTNVSGSTSFMWYVLHSELPGSITCHYAAPSTLYAQYPVAYIYSIKLHYLSLSYPTQSVSILYSHCIMGH
jgi:hypothetical protein